ncbi:hypothetical protein MKW98_020951 [Papaver atlanticum]|uniref:Uncharacterized protein n=1 Tax=Papaver atlanticum TaxID=357466 RepID=A0AAD4TA62_9MAGN|nr:hypothetical protein MKW98_020951 [Papaver atlanticum]
MASSSLSALQFHVPGGTYFPSTNSRKSKNACFVQSLNYKFGSPLLNMSKKCSNIRRNCVPVVPVEGKVVGIDLGTTNSAVATMKNGKPTIISSIPSVVAYTQNGDILVGETAKRQASENPENTFFSVKRFIGRNISEVRRRIQTIIELEYASADVLSSFGDTHLGGDDFDKRIVDWLADSLKRDEGTDLLKDKRALQCLTEAAEKAKIDLPFITETPKQIKTTPTRAKFEDLCSDLLDQLKVAVENSLRYARLAFNDVDEVILVGGSTRIPAVQELVKKLTGRDPNDTVHPDEKVALGAAIQAGVLSGDVERHLFNFYDRLTLPLGLETSGGVMDMILPKFQRLPDSMLRTFSTIADGQTSIVVHVLQGESKFVGDNKSLGSFRIDGIFPAQRDVPKARIEVEFSIDVNGILSVEATDQGSGEKLDITRL